MITWWKPARGSEAWLLSIAPPLSVTSEFLREVCIQVHVSKSNAVLMVVVCCRTIILYHLLYFKTFVKSSFLPPVYPSCLDPCIWNIQLSLLLINRLTSWHWAILPLAAGTRGVSVIGYSNLPTSPSFPDRHFLSPVIMSRTIYSYRKPGTLWMFC